MLILSEDNILSLVSSNTLNNILAELSVNTIFRDFRQIWREEIATSRQNESFNVNIADILGSALKEPILRFVPLSTTFGNYREKESFSYSVVIAVFTSTSVEVLKVTISQSESSNL